MRNLRFRRALAIGLPVAAAGLLYAMPTLAIASIVPNCARVNALQTPGLDCVMQTFRNVAGLVVGITGSFALLMFVYGGFMLLTSGGVESKVTTGKTILKNAIIGIVLIFTAGYIIDYGVNALRGRHYVTAGTACGPGGRGRYEEEGGYMVCKGQCTQLAPDYVCGDPNVLTGCIAGFTCGEGEQCCSTPAPPAPANPDDAPSTNSDATPIGT